MGKDLYPLQISMDHAEVMHILQTVRNVNQLNTTSARVIRGQVVTCKLNAVNMLIPLDKVIDIPIFHPFGNQSEPMITHCHSKERQDIGMAEMFPSNALPAESLIDLFRRVRGTR